MPQKDKESLDKKVLYVIGVFLTLAFAIIMISYYGNKVLNGSRAYIAGESHWATAQRNAVVSLIRYVNRKNENDFERFKKELRVIEGDKKARLSLNSAEPDYKKAVQGFLQGNNHPENVSNIIWLYNNFKDVPQMRKAIDIWEQAEIKIAMLESVGMEVHKAVQNDALTEKRKVQLLDIIYTLDEELTMLERDFLGSIGEAARWASRAVFWTTVTIILILFFIAGAILIRLIQGIRKINQKLKSAETKFRNVLDNSRDVIYQMDMETGSYGFMSESVEQMIGYTSEEIVEKGPKFMVDNMHPEDQKRMGGELKNIKEGDLEDHFKTETEFRIKTKAGNYIWVSNKRRLCFDDEGKPDYIIGSVRDISARKAYEDKINKSLKEKEVLLKEIHHRVKNNLAVISGLLELQRGEVGSKSAEILDTSQMRIQSIAMVHEKLYQSQTFANISMREYVNELLESLEETYRSDGKKIEIVKELDDVTLDITHAVPCGLILNELLNNAFKYAFNDRKQGMLKVGLQNNGSSCVVSVADNGPGLPEDLDIENGQSLGMELINTLSTQLGADVEVNSSDSGTEFKVSFAS